MSSLADRMKLALQGPPKRTQAALARACEVKPPSVHGWVSGGTKTIEASHLLKAAAFLGVNSKWLSDGVGPMRSADGHSGNPSPKGGKTDLTTSMQTASDVTSGEAGEPSNVAPGPDLREVRYPVISWVQAGEWSEAVDTFHPGDAEEWMASPKDLGRHGFILRVKGDSMTNPDGGRDNFPDGMLIHVQPEADVAPGDYVIAKRMGDGEATFKRLVNVDGELFLQAINPAWPRPFIKLEPGDKIVGKVKHSGWDF